MARSKNNADWFVWVLIIALIIIMLMLLGIVRI